MYNVFHAQRRRRIKGFISEQAANFAGFVNFRCTCDTQKVTHQSVFEIIVTPDLLCLILQDGSALALDYKNHQVLCHLVQPELYAVRTLCFNKRNNSIIVVHHFKNSDSALSMSFFTCESIRRGAPQTASVSSSLRNLIVSYPGFIEFEEYNGKIVTSTMEDGLFRFWDMEKYQFVFSVSNNEFQEMRISHNTVAFFKVPRDNCLPVTLRSIDTGELLASCSITLLSNHNLRFLELCGTCLLIKQEHHCVRVYNFMNKKDTEISDLVDFLPKAITFFPEKTFLSCNSKKVNVGHFLAIYSASIEIFQCTDGQLRSLARLQTHPPYPLNDSLQILHEQDILFLYTKHGTSLRHNAKGSGWMTSNIQRQADTDGASRLICQQSGYNQDENQRPDHICEQGNRRQKEHGILIVDLSTYMEISFLPLYCENIVNVFVFDPYRREILIGGSKGLHCLKTIFQRVRDTDRYYLPSKKSHMMDEEGSNQVMPSSKVKARLGRHQLSSIPKKPYKFSSSLRNYKIWSTRK